jgi:hypothetical protein
VFYFDKETDSLRQCSYNSIMETHRYVRHQLVENKLDQYDLNVRRSGLSVWQTTEYWTNGKTTLLEVRPKDPTLTNTRERTTIMMSSEDATAPVPAPAAKSSSSSSSNTVYNSLRAGSVAGVAATIICHPFDVLRVKMQSASLATPSAGVTGTFRHTVHHGGFRALYTGLTMPLAAQAIYKATVFTVNAATQDAILDWRTLENYKLGNFQQHQLTMTDRFICGFMGGAINAAAFVTPVEYVRNQLIVAQHSQQAGGNGNTLKNNNNMGPLSVIRNTITSDGVSGLWRGMGSTVLRDSVGCGCFFVAMACVQQKLSGDEQPPTRSSVILSGAAAGVSFWLWALPIDTMKTWIQSGTAKNLRHALQLSQAQGVLHSLPALFRGWQMAYGRGAPSAAITVTTYSLAYQYLAQGE